MSKEEGKAADDRIHVAVRIRPSRKRRSTSTVFVNSPNTIKIRVPAPTAKVYFYNELPPGACSTTKQFNFDACFDQKATQEQIFEKIGSDVVDYALKGYNAAVLAYGTTNSGKTHTCMGSDINPGLVPRIAASLASHLLATRRHDPNMRTSIALQMVEIYDEIPYDLLSCDHVRLKFREHPTRGPFCQGCSMVSADDIEEMISQIESGQRRRTSATTSHNCSSSRSHAIVMMTITQHNIANGVELVSQLHLVDLAGSERASSHRSGTGDGIYVKESSTINRSLTVLGCVIDDLVEHGVSHAYRQSKLTFLLRPALDRQAKLWLLATVSPNERNVRDTVRTLEYAQRAMKVSVIATVNETRKVAELEKWRNDIKTETERVLSGARHVVSRTLEEEDWDRIRKIVKLDSHQISDNVAIVSQKVKALLQHREQVQTENRRLLGLLSQYCPENASAGDSILPPRSGKGPLIPHIFEFATRHGLLNRSLLIDQIVNQGNPSDSDSDNIRRHIRWAADHLQLAAEHQMALAPCELQVIRQVIDRACPTIGEYGVVAILDTSSEHDYLVRASRLNYPDAAPRLLFWDSNHLPVDNFRNGFPNTGGGIRFVKRPQSDQSPMVLCEVLSGNVRSSIKTMSKSNNEEFDTVIFQGSDDDQWSLLVSHPFQAIPRYRIMTHATPPSSSITRRRRTPMECCMIQ